MGQMKSPVKCSGKWTGFIKEPPITFIFPLFFLFFLDPHLKAIPIRFHTTEHSPSKRYKQVKQVKLSKQESPNFNCIRGFNTFSKHSSSHSLGFQVQEHFLSSFFVYYPYYSSTQQHGSPTRKLHPIDGRLHQQQKQHPLFLHFLHHHLAFLLSAPAKSRHPQQHRRHSSDYFPYPCQRSRELDASLSQ
ncbi:MAG: hypothetical protein J3R72DRAFT_431882 [Linnemannia gamsii]|nr:MAG: hypothetical protein J3R72DRAFT_431882 [Linnemannia gamsii]